MDLLLVSKRTMMAENSEEVTSWAVCVGTACDLFHQNTDADRQQQDTGVASMEAILEPTAEDIPRLTFSQMLPQVRCSTEHFSICRVLLLFCNALDRAAVEVTVFADLKS